MVVDSSVIVAIALEEPGYELLTERLMSAECIIATPTLLECHMVLRNRAGEVGIASLQRILLRSGVQAVSFDETHLRAAADAFDKYGKGRHPAALNFGDCISYALSKVSGQSLPYVGDDFAKTDVSRV